MVEMLISLPVLVLLIVGAIEMGRVVLLHVAVTNAAREGAYYLANNPQGTALATAVENELNYTGVTLSGAPQVSGSLKIYQPIMVTVNACGHGFLIINRFVAACGANGISVSSSAAMMVVR